MEIRLNKEKLMHLSLKGRCSHLKIIKINSFRGYCPKCGILSFKGTTSKHSKHFVKPLGYGQECSFDPFAYITMYKKKYRKQKHFKKSLDIPSWYYKDRLEQINLIKSMYQKMKASIETYFMAIEYLDLYVGIVDENIFDQKTLNLAAIACFIIAYKFIEKANPYEDNLKNFTIVFSTSKIKLMEISILQALNYDLSRITIYDIASSIKYFGFIVSSEIDSNTVLKNLYKEMDTLLMNKIVYNNAILSTDYIYLIFSTILYLREYFEVGDKYFQYIAEEIYKYDHGSYEDGLNKFFGGHYKKTIQKEEENEAPLTIRGREGEINTIERLKLLSPPKTEKKIPHKLKIFTKEKEMEKSLNKLSKIRNLRLSIDAKEKPIQIIATDRPKMDMHNIPVFKSNPNLYENAPDQSLNQFEERMKHIKHHKHLSSQNIISGRYLDLETNSNTVANNMSSENKNPLINSFNEKKFIKPRRKNLSSMECYLPRIEPY